MRFAGILGTPPRTATAKNGPAVNGTAKNSRTGFHIDAPKIPLLSTRPPPPSKVATNGHVSNGGTENGFHLPDNRF